MALTQISTQGIKDGTITGTDLATNVDLVDNQKLRLGNSQDLQIFHSGGDNFIKGNASTSRLFIDSCNEVQIRHLDTDGSNSEKMIVCNDDGAVELYHDSSKRFETTSGGINVIGMIDTTENIDIDADNQALRIGASQNFQLVFTGSEAIIKNVGATSPIKIKVKDGVEDAIVCNANGAVELYHGNSKKLQTESWGVDITGTLRADTLKLTDDHKLQFGIGNDLEIYHDGSNSYIEDAGTGALLIKSNTLYLTGTNAANDLASFVEGGAVSLFHNDSKKFETTSAGATLHGELNATGANFTDDGQSSPIVSVLADDNNPWGIQVGNSTYSNNAQHGWQVYVNNAGEAYTYNIGSSTYNDMHWYLSNSSTSKLCIKIDASEGPAVQLYHDNSKKFETTSSGATMSGSLLINNSNGVNVFSSISMTETSSYGFITSFSGKGIFLRPTSNGVYLDAGDTSFSSGSDERSKTDLTPISDALSKINNCRSVIGRYKTDDISVKRSFLIAQDFQSNFPEAVSVDKNTTEEGNLGLRYQDVIPLLLAGIKELSTKIDVLETEVATLKAA